MGLIQFDVAGQSFEEDAEYPVDPFRSLVRYRSDGSELFVHVRLNPELLQAAVALPILLLKPVSRDDELMKIDALLTPDGSVRNYTFLDRIWQDVRAAGCPACYLAEQHGDKRRDFYFVTEDTAAFEAIARGAAEASGYPLSIETFSLSQVALVILPAEVIGDLDLSVAEADRIRLTRFEFWGAEPSLTRLRTALEARGYRFQRFDAGLSELRMLKAVAIDGPGFRAVLKEIAPLALSLGCSYRGTETLGGFDQFRLGARLPDRYAAERPKGLFGRLFGKS